MENQDFAADPTVGGTPSDVSVQRVLTLLERALAELDRESDGARHALGEAALLLRERIGADAAAGGDGRRGLLLAWQARRVRDYIDAHSAAPLRIADLCALIGRSEGHFSRSFKRTFGVAPHGYLIRHRVGRAAHYMLETDASLSDIAVRCGFTDQAHLSKHFRQLIGKTPAAWRRASTATHQAPPGVDGLTALRAWST